MTLEQFLKEYNYASWDHEKVAYFAEQITDSPELAASAKAYMWARQTFEEDLEKVGFSFG